MTKFAVALFDNEAESDEELSFKKNDLLQIEQIDFMGMQGWWLCKLTKDNRTGLAPGNRLKITNDEQIISKFLNKKTHKHNSTPVNTDTTSIVPDTSNISKNTQINLEQITSSLERVSIEPESTNRIILPAKIKTNNNSVLKLNGSESNYNTLKKSDEDDDYDIPENNRPLSKLIKELQDSRKSISPTIDSGISTSSLISLNSELLINILETESRSSTSQRISDYSNFDEPKPKNDSKYDFDEKIERINHLLTNLENFNSNHILVSDNYNSLKTLVNEFINNNLKILKREHVCFHPDLNTFNKFKKMYDQIEAYHVEMNKYENFSYSKNELNEFKQFLKQLKCLVEEKNLFNYHNDTNSVQSSSTQDNDYQYEYDNNHSNDDSYQNEGDYCEIDELEEQKCTKVNRQNLEKLVEKVSNTSALCMTLKRSDEKIRQEIKLATSLSDCEASKINLSDQMLLKFYLKHIEENFNDLKIIFDVLIERLKHHQCLEVELANKLALNGHKLVFICDTLQRNLNNEILKINLYDLSNVLCNSLKNYMIKIKQETEKSFSIRQLDTVRESLNCVYNSADNFKKFVIKNVYNNF